MIEYKSTVFCNKKKTQYSITIPIKIVELLSLQHGDKLSFQILPENKIQLVGGNNEEVANN